MRFFFVIACCSFFCFAQNKEHDVNAVKCFYENKAKPIFIFNKKNGSIVDTLQNAKEENTWYKLTITESDYGWFKINTIERIPNKNKEHHYKNFWVRNSDFNLYVKNEDEDHAYIYDLPTTSSNRIHKLDNGQKVQVTEISELWAKIVLIIGEKKVAGWLPYKDQCANLKTCYDYEKF